jgi:hypothetical protein
MTIVFKSRKVIENPSTAIHDLMAAATAEIVSESDDANHRVSYLRVRDV